MSIINNRTGSNHHQKLINCFKAADEIIIVSPFIAGDLSFFPFDKISHLKKITLITRLKPYTLDQYEKVNFFYCLFEFGEANNIIIEILIDNLLHGKIYIGCKHGLHQEAIITSANFNTHGLVVNNEWGVSLNDANEIKAIVAGLRERILIEAITKEKLAELKAIIDANPVEKPKREVKVNLSKQLQLQSNPLRIEKNTTYWLKPIGVSGNSIPWGESFMQIEYPLHFSENPSGLRIGHIIIAYAVGHGNLLSIYEVISGTKNTGNPNDRWPYYVIGKNLTPYYGENWHHQKLTIGNQRTYVLGKGLFDITPSGVNTYGHLMQGGDKLKLTGDFAKYLINKIVKINKVIADNLD